MQLFPQAFHPLNVSQSLRDSAVSEGARLLMCVEDVQQAHVPAIPGKAAHLQEFTD